MAFAFPPATAAWQHRGARSGFEVVYFQARGSGCHIEGWTTAIEEGQTWAVEYAIELDVTWATRRAWIRGRSASGFRSILLESSDPGQWLADGKSAPRLDGCLDVDLESSAMTNALPVRRLGLPAGGRAAAPAVYVRAADEASRQRYDYTAPAFDFGCRLVYDEYGLVLDYPGIAVRAG